jgi:PAS domain S-box-containing protein
MDGRIIECNDLYCQMLGYSPDELRELTYQQLTPERWRAFEESIVQDQIIAGGYSDVYEKEYRRKDGAIIPVELRTMLSRDASGRPDTMWAIVRDITERKRAQDTQRLLLAELDHRVKNTLATVQAIALQTLSAACDPTEFVESFNGRSRALGRAHGLLTRTSWQGADLATLIKEQLTLGPEASDWRVSSSGPQVLLEPQAALHLGLVLHELGTNARKYGSLSQPEGRLTTEWSLSSEAGHAELLLKWVESDGPPVAPPGKSSFGTTLIERSLRYALGGEARLTFAPTGVTCEISLPLPLLGNGAYSANLPERPQ